MRACQGRWGYARERKQNTCLNHKYSSWKKGMGYKQWNFRRWDKKGKRSG